MYYVKSLVGSGTAPLHQTHFFFCSNFTFSAIDNDRCFLLFFSLLPVRLSLCFLTFTVLLNLKSQKTSIKNISEQYTTDASYLPRECHESILSAFKAFQFSELLMWDCGPVTGFVTR